MLWIDFHLNNWYGFKYFSSQFTLVSSNKIANSKCSLSFFKFKSKNKSLDFCFVDFLKIKTHVRSPTLKENELKNYYVTKVLVSLKRQIT